MNPLDQELKNALRRQEPSADFTQRVMAGLQPEPAPDSRWGEAIRNLLRFPSLRWATAAALCALLTIGGLAYRRHQQTVTQGEMARAKVMLALHITSSKLNVALRGVQRADRRDQVQDTQRSE
ncbi:MAG TPA: hypothetical protein VKV95_09390 [Terriglobia bacterium]|nr:hypothetical protein [Terriglobia bacterium]